MISQIWLLPVLTISSSGLVAFLSAWFAFRFTKRREYEADLRKIKLAQYQEFVRAVSGNVEGRSTPKALAAYSDAYNNMQLVSSTEVLEKLHKFQVEISIVNKDRSILRERELWDDLVSSMRKDLFEDKKNPPVGISFGYISVPPNKS